MKAIIHLEVGDSYFTPTGEELKEIVNEFKTKPMPAFAHKIKVTELILDALVPERLMIEAGNSKWSPTQEELDELMAQFETVTSNPNGGVVATRSGVRVTYIPARVLSEAE